MPTKRIPDVEFCRRRMEIVDEVHKTRKPIIIPRDLVMLLPVDDARPPLRQRGRKKS
jgi:hypothetical protein